jgi:hypothetical protein
MVAARPLHLIHGGASLTYTAFPRISLIHVARPGPSDGPRDGLGATNPAGQSQSSASSDQAVDQAVDSAVDSRLSRGITPTFLWISQGSGKILKFLARMPCAGSPEQSTNSFTARAEVLPGGNPRDAGETRATGKPGNRKFSCFFQARRRAAEHQEAG